MPCVGLVSIIPVSIALSGGVNVSGIFGSGISISAGSGSPVVVITRGPKDSIFVGLSGSQNIATHGSITVANSGFNLIVASGGVGGGNPNAPLYVSDLSAGLITAQRPTSQSSFVQRVAFATFYSGGVIVNPDSHIFSLEGRAI